MDKQDLWMTVEECSKILRLDAQTIRIAIQQEKLPFGMFVKKEGKKYGGYYILRHQVYEYLGIQKSPSAN